MNKSYTYKNYIVVCEEYSWRVYTATMRFIAEFVNSEEAEDCIDSLTD